MTIFGYEPLFALVILLTAVLGVGRLVRVITYDQFPPSIWWRDTWRRITNDGPWAKLFTCFWCLPFWVVLVNFGWFYAGTFVDWIAIAWWVFWGALAVAYLASMVIARDSPEE